RGSQCEARAGGDGHAAAGLRTPFVAGLMRVSLRQCRSCHAVFMNTITLPGFATAPTRFLFFTGKGGVGKTSLSTATAIAIADAGMRVLLVSTDAASNLDDMLGITLSNQPVDVPGVTGLSVINIDPDAAAEA